jgi:23S rRNA pseudouridine955/2504/2580 synthase/23S rRNA pseudouridine1911/1915/1917 synthase
MAPTQWTVLQEDSGSSLLHYIAKKHPELSAKKIKKLIDAGKCTLNGHIEKFSSQHVGRGDRIVFTFDEIVVPQGASPLLTTDRILYADKSVVAYDKPPGVVSDDPRLITLLQQKIPNPTLLHRLDKNTSGVLLFATKGPASDHIEKQFRQRTIHKQYMAIIDGVPKQPSGNIEMSMGKLSQYEGQAVWGEVEKGLWSETAWNIEERGNAASLVICKPKTGRTHQIRVHLASIGHPILGDFHYGKKFMCTHQPPRMMLHASQVDLTHPVTGAPLTIRAELPADFQQFFAKVKV